MGPSSSLVKQTTLCICQEELLSVAQMFRFKWHRQHKRTLTCSKTSAIREKEEKNLFDSHITFYGQFCFFADCKADLVLFFAYLIRIPLNAIAICEGHAPWSLPKRRYLKGLKGQTHVVVLRHCYLPHTLFHWPVVIGIIGRLDLSFIFTYLTSTDCWGEQKHTNKQRQAIYFLGSILDQCLYRWAHKGRLQKPKLARCTVANILMAKPCHLTIHPGLKLAQEYIIFCHG